MSNKKSFRSEFIKTMAQFVTASFAFVAALAWNEFIKDFINRFISPGAGLRSRLIYALFVTFLAVIAAYYLGRLTQEAHQEEKVEEKKAEKEEEKKK